MSSNDTTTRRRAAKDGVLQGDDFKRVVRIELAKQDLNQAQLAKKMGVSSTTLSDWLRGSHPGPADLHALIEKALKLPLGHLEKMGWK